MNTKTIYILCVMVLLIGISSVYALPNAPTTLTNTTSADYVKWSWGVGGGNVTDSYNISREVESITTFYNDTTNTYIAWSGLGGNSVTIVIYAYNTTTGLSSGSITDTLIVPEASATSIDFTPITAMIDAIIPLFTSLLDLIIAAMPLLLIMAFFGGLSMFITKIFDGTLDINRFMGRKR